MLAAAVAAFAPLPIILPLPPHHHCSAATSAAAVSTTKYAGRRLCHHHPTFDAAFYCQRRCCSFHSPGSRRAKQKAAANFSVATQAAQAAEEKPDVLFMWTASMALKMSTVLVHQESAGVNGLLMSIASTAIDAQQPLHCLGCTKRPTPMQQIPRSPTLLPPLYRQRLCCRHFYRHQLHSHRQLCSSRLTTSIATDSAAATSQTPHPLRELHRHRRNFIRPSSTTIAAASTTLPPIPPQNTPLSPPPLLQLPSNRLNCSPHEL